MSPLDKKSPATPHSTAKAPTIDPKAVENKSPDPKAIDVAIKQTPLRGDELDWKVLSAKLNDLAKQHATQEKQGDTPTPKEIYRWSAAYNMAMRKSLMTDDYPEATHGLKCSGPKDVDFTQIGNSLRDNDVKCAPKKPRGKSI